MPKSSNTESSVAAQSTNPKSRCPSSRGFTSIQFSSVRIDGRASVRLVSRVVVCVGNCRSVTMEVVGSSGGACSDRGSTKDVVGAES
jgi:hypothetical protein